MHQLKSGLVAVGLISAVVAIAPQANAASPFTGFNFTTQVTGTPMGSGLDPKKDIMLQSVKIGSQTIGNFELVKTANIIQNTITVPTPGEHGPASSDHGDLVATSGSCPLVDAGATGADIAGSLGNRNLNCIVDTEDNIGTSIIDVFFAPNKLANTFFFFERGMNSDIEVQGIDINNVVSPAFKISYKDWANAGYKIDTTEITKGAQTVGSYGLSSAKTRFKGLRLSSRMGFNGPDFKVVATQVPEPASMLGLGIVSSAAVLLRRRKATQG